MAKIIFQAEDDVETLWAEQLPSGLFRLDNNPFFFYGVSADDILEATPEPDAEGMFRFVRVIERSGNYTIRIYSEETDIDAEAFKPVLNRLVELGCDYEGFAPSLLSVMIPAGTDVDPVLEFLNDRELMWEYGNPTYEELFGDEG